MLAAMPSARSGPELPRWRASSSVSHRRIPSEGTASHSGVIGSNRSSAMTLARRAASGSGRPAEYRCIMVRDPTHRL